MLLSWSGVAKQGRCSSLAWLFTIVKHGYTGSLFVKLSDTATPSRVLVCKSAGCSLLRFCSMNENIAFSISHNNTWTPPHTHRSELLIHEHFSIRTVVIRVEGNGLGTGITFSKKDSPEVSIKGILAISPAFIITGRKTKARERAVTVQLALET